MKAILIILMVVCIAVLLLMSLQIKKKSKDEQDWLKNLKSGDKVYVAPDKKQMRVFANTFDGYVWLYDRKNKFGSMKKVPIWQISEHKS